MENSFFLQSVKVEREERAEGMFLNNLLYVKLRFFGNLKWFPL